MSQHIHYHITRRPDVLSQLAISNTSLHVRIKAGLLPPPISLGGRAVGWVESELDSVLSAMVAGHSEDQLRELVSSLIEQRKLAA